MFGNKYVYNMFSVYMTEADVTLKIVKGNIFVVLKGAQEIQYSFKENIATRLLYPRIAETCTFYFTLLVFQTFFFSCLSFFGCEPS